MDRKLKTLKECPIIYREGAYIAVNNGWDNIIYDMSIKLEALVQKTSISYSKEKVDGQIVNSRFGTYIYRVEDNRFKISKIVEKYGRLRVYCDYVFQEMRNIINESEKLCTETCEICSDKGMMRDDKDLEWIMTLCKPCYISITDKLTIKNILY